MRLRIRLDRALDAAFPAVFTAYVAFTVAILALALAPALVPTAAPPADHPAPAGAAEQFALMLGHTALHTEDAGSLLVDYGLSILNLGTGLILFARRPRDPVARLLAVGMVGTSLAFNYQGHALFVGEAELFVQAEAAGGHLPIAPILNIFHLLYHGLSGAAYAHALLLFPNGVFSPRWLLWPVVAMYLMLVEEVGLAFLSFMFGLPVFPLLLVVLTVVFGTVVGESGLPCTPEVCPQGTAVSFDFSAIVASDVAFFIMFFGFVIPAAGIYSLRSRRALLTPLQRSQSEVVVAALGFAFAVGIAAMVLSFFLVGAPRDVLSREAAQLRDIALKVFPPLYAVIPLSVVVAILRYRLFDIERLVNRAIVYTALSLVLIAIYAASVVVLQTLLRPFVGGSDLSVAGATLLIVALFQPLRRRVQDLIDSRFYRRRYDARGTIDAFTSRVGREVDLDAVGADLVRVVHDTVEPSHVSLWLRGIRR